MRAVVALLVASIVGGCLAPAVSLDANSVAGDDLVAWTGATLAAPGCGLPEGLCRPAHECTPENCERTRFEVPAGASGVLEVSIRYPTAPTLFELKLVSPTGAEVAREVSANVVGVFALVALVPDPAPGPWEAIVLVTSGASDYEGVAQIEPAIPADAGALLPNLVTLPPTDLTVDTPRTAGANYVQYSPTPAGTGKDGCRAEEIAENGAVRCLRFSNAVANVGAGPLDIRLPATDAARRQFLQRVWNADGTFEDAPGGTAEWHATHAHWHNAATNRFTVHRYDLATGAVGDVVAEGAKGGVCYADIGLAALGLPFTSEHREDGLACFGPLRETGDEREWAMGLSPNWYDLYPAYLPDQYVDVGELADGAYALCSTTNAEGTLRESTLRDNEACTPFELAGDAVTELAERPYHAMRG